MSTINISVLEKKAEELETALREVRLLIQLARKYAAETVQPAATVAAQVVENMATRKLTKQQRIFDTCREILSDGKRRLSRELLPELEQRGVIVGGKNPKSLLSSYLSTAPALFQSDVAAGGWTLATLAKKARPSEVAASPGLFPDGVVATYHARGAWKEGAEFD